MSSDFSSQYYPNIIYINEIIQNIVNFSYLFNQTDNIAELVWYENIDKSSFMFHKCSDITEIDLSNFDSSNINEAQYMFTDCISLTSINFSGFNTDKVKLMFDMFRNCSSLTSLDLSSFDTSNVNNMEHMFESCSSLSSLNISNFDFSQVTDIACFFRNCTNLEYFNMIKFNKRSLNWDVEMFDNIPNNIVICIGYIDNNAIYKNIKSKKCLMIDCSENWKINQKKLVNGGDECIDKCNDNTQYKFEYNGKCLENCSKGVINDNQCKCELDKCLFCSPVSLSKNLCTECNDNYFQIENDPLNIGEYINCYEDPEGYYLDIVNSLYKKCYHTCKTCEIKGNQINQNCILCNDEFPLNFNFNNSNNYINCYKNCSYNYYFDNDYNFFCTNNSECPKEYPYLKEENLFPNINRCVNKIPENYYLDERDNIYKPCHEICKKCYGRYDNCTECFTNYSLIIDHDKVNTCFKCDFYYFFNNNNDYSCICPNNYKNIGKNKCINKCKNDNIYKYEYIDFCYKNCPNGTHEINNFICYNNSLSNEQTTDNEIATIIGNLKNGDMNNIIDEVTNNNQVYSEKVGNAQLYLLNLNNQNNNSFGNMSIIDLGECEKELKDIYKINQSLSLIMLKIEYYLNDSLIPIIGYEVYEPNNLTLLNLSLCNSSDIYLYIPVKIDENNLFKYDPNSKYYTSKCFSYTTEDGTDIILKDRQKEFSDKNLSLCENKCNYMGYDSINKQSSCFCKMKNEIEKLSEIMNNPNKLSNEFESKEKTISSSSMLSVECTNVLFTINGLKSNISSYILSIIIFYYLFSIITFIKCGFPLLREEINNIVEDKKQIKKSITRKNKSNINKLFPPRVKRYNFSRIKINLDKDKRYHRQLKSGINSVNSNNNINGVISNINNVNSNNNINSFSNNKSKATNNNKNNFLKRKKIVSYNFNDFELNNMDYKEAILYDKRTCIGYYISLLKFKHPLLFGFCPIKDYNSIIVKSCIFFLSFSILYAINFLFINEKTIHKIYEEGKYNIFYFIPQITISFAITNIITVIIKYIFLSQGNLKEIKIVKTYNKAVSLSYKIIKKLVIKNVFFFIIGLIYLFVFWLFLSSFGAVYQNTQVILIENTLISFGISLVYPFFINVIPSLFRVCAVSDGNKNSECLYKISKLLQLV